MDAHYYSQIRLPSHHQSTFDKFETFFEEKCNENNDDLWGQATTKVTLQKAAPNGASRHMPTKKAKIRLQALLADH